MQDFSKELAGIRKQRNLTQDALAQRMNVSRQTISHWENGRVSPDLENIRRLSEILEFDFIRAVNGNTCDESAQDVKSESETGQEETQEGEAKRGFKKKLVWIFILAAALVCLAGGIVLTQTKKPEAKIVSPMKTLEPFTKNWYMQKQIPAPGETLLDIYSEENPQKAIRSDEFLTGVGWFYSFKIMLTQGESFLPTRVTLGVFSKLTNDKFVWEGEKMSELFEEELIPGKTYEFNGGFPIQDISGVGLAIEGTDETGDKKVFRSYIELSKEIVQQ